MSNYDEQNIPPAVRKFAEQAEKKVQARAEETAELMRVTIDGALDKLKASMDGGPEGSSAVLTPQEATVLYRSLTEVFGIPHAGVARTVPRR